MCFLGQYLSNLVQYTRNRTSSEKEGIYLLFQAKLKRNDIYQICLNESKTYSLGILIQLGLQPSTTCKNGYAALLKKIIGMPGDLIQISKDGVLINQILLPSSKGIDKYKRLSLYPLPIGFQYKLSNNEYWLSGNGVHSFDSRYFGAVNKNEIMKRAIWILP